MNKALIFHAIAVFVFLGLPIIVFGFPKLLESSNYGIERMQFFAVTLPIVIALGYLRGYFRSLAAWFVFLTCWIMSAHTSFLSERTFSEKLGAGIVFLALTLILASLIYSYFEKPKKDD